MIRRTLVLIALAFLFLGKPHSLCGQIAHQVAFTESLAVETILLDDGNTYSRVTIPNEYATIDTAGHPALPVRFVKLLLPANSRATEVVASYTSVQSIMLELPVEPVQHPIPTATICFTPSIALWFKHTLSR